MKCTIFGANGLLGRELLQTKSDETDTYSPSSSDIDLIKAVPLSSNNDLWINCAAKVGGVNANSEKVSEFYETNSKIGNNVFEGAKNCNVKKMTSVLSTCIYPDEKFVSYPLTEEQLHIGPPHESNFGYAYAKRMLDVQSRAHRRQFGSNYITVVPNNLYGLNDNYDTNDGHVIPSLIRKFFEAKQNATDVVIWGSGNPLREFTFARDAAKIIWWLSNNYNEESPVNIGNTEEISIGDLATLISKIMGFKKAIRFDKTMPEGQFRKPTSNKKLQSLGCKPNYTPLKIGLEETIAHFTSSYPNVRGIEP